MSGYIGTQPIPQATQTRETFTATAGQTSFATAGYTPNYLDAYLNGVKLVNGTDFTATNGSDVVLTSGAAESDTLEVLAYSTFEVNSQNFTGGLTVNNDGATVLTVDRATSDGTLVDFQKDGTSVGGISSISSNGPQLRIGDTSTGLCFRDDLVAIIPSNSTSLVDNTTNIGASFYRFKDLYLSGGVYLGGTGAANKLDDYEEGTWTPDLKFGGSNSGITYSDRYGYYTKVGDLCTISFRIYLSSKGSASGSVRVAGMPFTAYSKNGGSLHYYANMAGLTGAMSIGIGGGSEFEMFDPSSSATNNLDNGNFNNNAVVEGSLTYKVS